MSVIRGILAGVIVSMITVLACVGVFLLGEMQVANTTETEYIIVDMHVGFPENGVSEYSIYTISLADGSYYTLPAIKTAYVRSYYIGDKLPVIVREFKDGTKELKVNKSKLYKS